MELFFFQQESKNVLILEKDEARHCVRVLRHKSGDKIFGVDGKGHFFEARIAALGKDLVKADILKTVDGFGEHQDEIHIGVSVLGKESRFEWIIEKAVELGVTRITPIQTKRTLKPRIRAERLNRIMVSALKQCMRSKLPVLDDPCSLDSFLKENQEGLKLIGRADAENHIRSFESEIEKNSCIVLLVGPEGDFTNDEMSLAKSSGFIPVQLGSQRLRAETAAIHFLSLVKFIRGY